MDLFRSFEYQGMDHENVWHIFALQYMFMPRIQLDLDTFKAGWNNHPLSTERNKSPLQLLMLQANDFAPENDSDDYGVENDSDDEDIDVDVHVQCHPLRCPLNPQNLAILKTRINPISLHTSQQDFSRLYYAALSIVNELSDL